LAREAQAALDPEAAASAIDALATAAFEGARGSAAATAAADLAFRRALALRTRTFGERSAETATSWSTLSTFAFMRGRWDESESWERKGLTIRREVLPPGDPRIADSLNDLGVVLVTQGRLTEAQPVIEESVRIFDASPQAPADKRLEARNSLGELYRLQDRPAESERTFREAIAVAEALAPDASMLTAALVNNLAGVLKDGGDLAEAETLTRRSLTPENPPPNRSGPTFGRVLESRGDLLSRKECRGGGAAVPEVHRPGEEGSRTDNPDLATHSGQLSVPYRETGRTDDARAWSDRALTLLERTLGADHPLLAQALHDRGVLGNHRGPAGRRALQAEACADDPRARLRGLASRGGRHADRAFARRDRGRP
jgi:tetratricopeptide (TPR) repeat protein